MSGIVEMTNDDAVALAEELSAQLIAVVGGKPAIIVAAAMGRVLSDTIEDTDHLLMALQMLATNALLGRNEPDDTVH